MYKENGRAAPADKTEYADVKVKTYKCNKCGEEVPVTNPEFGVFLVCPNCDIGELKEMV